MATNNILNTGVTPLAISQGGTSVNATPTIATASSFAAWDSNVNLPANSFIAGFATTATAAGTTTLTVGSAEQQHFTGTTTQTVVLPVVSTLTLGQSFTIYNASTGTVTVESSGANTIQVMAAGTQLIVTVILTTGTSAASWSTAYSNTSGSFGVITTGTANDLAYYQTSGTTISPLTSANNGLLVTSGSGVPSIGNAIGADIIINGVTAGRGTSNIATNTVFGAGSLTLTNTSRHMSIMGDAAGAVLTNGNDSVIIGYQALAIASVSSGDVVIGSQAMPDSAANNVVIGNLACNGSGAGSGTQVTVIGQAALTSSTSLCVGTVAIGQGTGSGGSPGGVAITSDSQSTLIGYSADSNAADPGHIIALGAYAVAEVATGATASDNGDGIAIGSPNLPMAFANGCVGFRGDFLPFQDVSSSVTTHGFWRPKINGINVFMPLFEDATLTASSVMMTDENQLPFFSDALTDGQFIIGATGAAPAAANLTAGVGISITNSANGVTIDATGGVGMAFTAVTGTTQAAASNHGYIPTNVATTTVTLPSTAAIGNVVAIQGSAIAGWVLAANTGQTIMIGAATTTTGGSLASDLASDSVWVVCIQANTVWSVYTSVSSGLTIA